MLKPLGIIAQFIVIVCMLLVSHGKDQCDCSCSLINYGVEDFCKSIKRATIKSDSNEAAITNLLTSHTQVILPFIEQSKRQSTKEENSKLKSDPSSTHAITMDLWKEIKKLKNEQRKLEEKVEKLEKDCLEKTDELLGNMKKSETLILEVKDELLGTVTMAKNRTLKLERELSEEIIKEKNRNLETNTELLRRINEAENRALKTEKKLSEEIKKGENRTLEIKVNLLERIIEVDNLCLKFEKEMSGKINESVNQILILRNSTLPGLLKKVEAQTSNIEHAFSAKVMNVENIILKVKKEVLEKDNDMANWTSKLKDEFLKRVSEVEENTSKKINELVMQMEKEDSALKSKMKAEQTTHDQLQKILNETRDKLRDMEVNQNETAVALRQEINSTGKDLEVHVYEQFLKNVYHRLYALEKKTYRRNTTLGDLKTKMENYTQVENHVNLYKEIFVILFDTFQAMDYQVLPTAEEFEEKSAHLEEVFRHSLSKYFSSTQTSVEMWSRIETTQSDQQKMFSNLTESVTRIQNEMKQCCPEDNIPTLNGDETAWKACEMRQNYSEIDSTAIYKVSATVENCGNVLLLDANGKRNSATTNNRRENPYQFLLLVQKKSKGGETFQNMCGAVLLNEDWAITSAHCIDDPRATYRIKVETPGGRIFQTKVRPFEHLQHGQFAPYRDDIALLNMLYFVPFSISHNFSPPCLLGQEGRDKVLGPAIFLGWDVVEKNNIFTPSSLQLSEVCLLTDEKCRMSHGPSFHNSMICTKPDKHVNKLCKGTHGGFLFKEIEDKLVLIGIVANCSSPDKPIIYTETSHFAEWIDSSIKNYVSRLIDEANKRL